jgi:hypothetical protein
MTRDSRLVVGLHLEVIYSKATEQIVFCLTIQYQIDCVPDYDSDVSNSQAKALMLLIRVE